MGRFGSRPLVAAALALVGTIGMYGMVGVSPAFANGVPFAKGDVLADIGQGRSST